MGSTIRSASHPACGLELSLGCSRSSPRVLPHLATRGRERASGRPGPHPQECGRGGRGRWPRAGSSCCTGAASSRPGMHASVQGWVACGF